jgi:F-type H+-transporting ATPase subunit b
LPENLQSARAIVKVNLAGFVNYMHSNSSLNPFRTIRTTVVSSALLITAINTESAFASEGGASHGGPSMGLLWLNFIIYVAVMYRLLKKPLASAWSNRREKIEAQLLASDRELAAAKREYDSAVAAANEVDSKVFEIMKQAREVANAEAAAVISGAREQATRVYNQSRMLADVEAMRAFRQLQLDLGDEIIAKAKQTLTARISPAVDRQIRGSSISKGETLKDLVMN